MATCKNCSTDFEIPQEDLEFYDKISPIFEGKKYPIPAPTFCPDCRFQRRIAWKNEHFLHQRKCDLCQKVIISIYAPEVQWPVYCNQCWWSDQWDAKKYGKDFDFSRPFFDQLKELMDAVPELCIHNDNGTGSINSQYSEDAAHQKNCYLVMGSWHTQDSFYSTANCSRNQSVCDTLNLNGSELCYEVLDSQKLYNCAFIQNSENSSDCFFGFDLKGCKNCFGCIGLRQKEFYIFNKPYTEAEYKKQMQAFNIGSYEALEKMKKQYAEWIVQFPRKFANLQNCENCEGNDLFNSRESKGFSIVDADHVKYFYQGDAPTHCYDIFNSGKCNWCYEGVVPDICYMSHFNWFSWSNKNTFYTIGCHSSGDLFGCVSLRRAQYCILNKQYTKEEYEKLVPRIIEHMRAGGEWGEFFPASISLHPYNESVAQEYFSLTKEQVLAKKWQWRDPDPKHYQAQTYIVPDHIRDAKEDITKAILACGSCGKNYKIIPEELKFYQKMGIPIPRLCQYCRHKNRLQRRLPYKLWNRICDKCTAPIKTSYAPERPEKVYCEKCYLEAVY